MNSTSQQRFGFLNAVAAYAAWGLIPIYFKMVAHVPPVIVLAHRIVWSVVFLGIVIGLQRRWREVIACARSKRMIGMLLFSALMLATNWLTFIYAVSTHRVLQSSLGYFINPLVTVLLGMIFLKERLRTLQVVALVLATIGVVNLAIAHGEVPWIALTLAGSFGLYGLLRKISKVAPLPGLMWETILLLPLAVPMVMFGPSSATSFEPKTLGLLMSAVVTTVPLLCFAAAAQRLRMSTMGFLQYIAPTGQFLLAVYVYGEDFTLTHRISFAFIWTAIAVYLGDSWRSLQRIAPTPAEAAPLAEA